MLTMTLETDCILALLDLLDKQQPEPEELAALAQFPRWAQQGAVSLWASFNADEAVAVKRHPWCADAPAVLPEWLSHLPRLGASVTAAEAIGMWSRGCGYPPVRVNAELSERLRRLQRMVFGSGSQESAVELLEHHQQGNEWFVTLDRRTLLAKHGRDNLKRHWHIGTCSPVEAVGLISLQKDLSSDERSKQ